MSETTKKINPYLAHPERANDEIYLGNVSAGTFLRTCRWQTKRVSLRCDEGYELFVKKSEIKPKLYNEKGQRLFTQEFTDAVLSEE